MFKPIEPLAQAPCENTEKGVITEVLLRIREETPVHTTEHVPDIAAEGAAPPLDLCPFMFKS